MDMAQKIWHLHCTAGRRGSSRMSSGKRATHHRLGIIGHHQGLLLLLEGVVTIAGGGRLGQGGQGDDDGVEGAGVGAADLGDLAVLELDTRAGRSRGGGGDGRGLAAGEEHEGGHGRDGVPLGDGGDVVDVDLGEGEAAREAGGGGHLGVQRRDGLARRAPVGVEVGDDVGVGREEGGELVGRGDVVDGAGGGGHVAGGRLLLGCLIVIDYLPVGLVRKRINKIRVGNLVINAAGVGGG